jgi:hypothetical protein
MSDEEVPPRRRLRLQLDLGADDIDSLAGELRSIAHDLEYDGREERDTVSGGYGAGYSLKVTVTDLEQTGDRFREELEEWRQRRVAERRAESVSSVSGVSS